MHWRHDLIRSARRRCVNTESRGFRAQSRKPLWIHDFRPKIFRQAVQGLGLLLGGGVVVPLADPKSGAIDLVEYTELRVVVLTADTGSGGVVQPWWVAKAPR